MMKLFDAPQRMVMRDYQMLAKQGGLAALEFSQSAFIEIATGGGKTLVAAAIAQEFDRAIIITPFDQTMGQVVATVKRFMGYSPEIEQGPLFGDPDAPVTVASLQSLMSNNRYTRYLSANLHSRDKIAIFDEAHASLGPKQAEIMAAFKATGMKIIGMSATPHYRPNGVSPLHQYDRYPVSIGMRQLIEWGRLTPFRIQRCVLKTLDMSAFSPTASKDFDSVELDRILGEECVMLEQCAMIASNHKVPGVVFTTGIKNARAMQRILNDRHGIPTVVVDSEMSGDDRAEAMRDFESGKAELIVNVGVLTTGWDSPRVAEIHNLRPTASLPKYIQMLGRGCRLESNELIAHLHSDYTRRLAIARSGKPYCDVYDYTDASRCHHICSGVDVFVPPTKKRQRYVEELIDREEPITMEEVDAALLAEQKRDQQAARIEREEELHRRRQLKFSAEVDREFIDSYQKGTADIPKRREARMIWGPYKGIPLRMIPKDYLQGWLRIKKKPGSEWLVDAVKRELKRSADERRQLAGR
jgi:superfamily II DNA or RNA helicase